MKHVGEALQGATKCLIGIATYGIVTNKDHLLESERNNFGGKFKYNVASSLVEQGEEKFIYIRPAFNVVSTYM